MAVNSFNAQNPPVNTKGDLFTFSTIPTKLAVGSNNTVLTADSTTATGLKWATASGGTKNFTLVNAGGTALSGSSTVTISGISNADQIYVQVRGASMNSGSNAVFGLRLNGDTAGNYNTGGGAVYGGSTYSTGVADRLTTWFGGAGTTGFGMVQTANNAACTAELSANIFGCNTSGVKVLQGVGGAAPTGGNGQVCTFMTGFYSGSSTISSVSIYTDTGTFDAGTIFVYTSA